jgi:hypothetical protein
MCAPCSGWRCILYTVYSSAHVCQYDEATQATYPGKTFKRESHGNGERFFLIAQSDITAKHLGKLCH